MLVQWEEGWEIISNGIAKLKKIMEKVPDTHFGSEEYMRIYTTIYNMCTQKPPHDYSQQLYDKYKDTFEEYIRTTVVPSIMDKHDEFMLRELVERWENHKVMVKWMSRFFHYLDRYFISKKSVPPLKEVGIRCFRDLVYEDLKAKLQGAAVSLIEQEREGKQIERAILKTVLDIFVEIGSGKLNCYQTDFEGRMLDDSADYYSRKASIWIVEDSCPDYMIKAEECLKKERERVSHYLHSSTEKKLIERVQNELLVVVCNQLLEKEHSGCQALLKNDKVDDLSRMYRLFCEIPKSLDLIANWFREHVTAEGNALVEQGGDTTSDKADKEAGSQDQAFIRKVMDLHDKYSTCVMDCFQGNALFHKALKDAFEVFCNKQVSGTSPAEMLASFCDNLLKKGGSEKLSDEEIEESLEKVVKLLAYISDKDLFAEFYKKRLSRRLLLDKSANNDQEKIILSKLKQQCGGRFTSKLEGMVTDITVARDHQNEFEEYLSNNKDGKPKLDFSVTVLTTGFWPSYKSSELNLPAEMVKCVEVFKEFYQTKTKHRKLTWIYSLGSCNVNGKFESKTIDMVVVTYQAAALLLFNTAAKLTYSEIQTQLNLADEDVVRVLQSLSCGKYKILTKTPNSKTVSENDSFEFNSKFTDKMRRIRIPLPVVDERKKIVEDVGKDRRYAIDAAVVRIMKARKVLGHQQLVIECIEQLSKSFKPDIKQIKKRIEDLITRDYLERDKRDPNTFHYLA